MKFLKAVSCLVVLFYSFAGAVPDSENQKVHRRRAAVSLSRDEVRTWKDAAKQQSERLSPIPSDDPHEGQVRFAPLDEIINIRQSGNPSPTPPNSPRFNELVQEKLHALEQVSKK